MELNLSNELDSMNKRYNKSEISTINNTVSDKVYSDGDKCSIFINDKEKKKLILLHNRLLTLKNQLEKQVNL